MWSKKLDTARSWNDNLLILFGQNNWCGSTSYFHVWCCSWIYSYICKVLAQACIVSIDRLILFNNRSTYCFRSNSRGRKTFLKIFGNFWKYHWQTSQMELFLGTMPFGDYANKTVIQIKIALRLFTVTSVVTTRFLVIKHATTLSQKLRIIWAFLICFENVF